MTESHHIPHLPPDSFELGKFIGRGGYGCVYQGKHQGAAVAIKQVVINNTSSDNTENAVLKEMKFLARLQRCNFVCEVIGYHFTNSMLSIVMELAENGDLQQYLRGRNLTGNWSKKASICGDIARAIQFVHAENIIHKDLKAANILLDKFLTPKLTDFGLSKNFTSLLHSTTQRGTFRYISPEQLKYPKKKFTDSEAILSDNYSYGLVLWEVASDGMLPYGEMEDYMIMLAKLKETEPLEYVGELSNETPQVFLELIEGFLESDPSKRSAIESALDRLGAYVNSNPLSYRSTISEELTATEANITADLPVTTHVNNDGDDDDDGYHPYDTNEVDEEWKSYVAMATTVVAPTLPNASLTPNTNPDPMSARRLNPKGAKSNTAPPDATSPSSKTPQPGGTADQNIRPVFIKGLFSVSTTSTKHPSVIRSDLIRVLERIGVKWREGRGGFECVHVPSIDLENVTGTSSYHAGTMDENNAPTTSQRHPSRLARRDGDNFSSKSGESAVSSKDKVLPPLPSEAAGPSNAQGAVPVLDLVVRFEIYIVKVPWLLGMHGLQFRRVGGDPWQYKNMCSKILNELKL